MIEKECSLGDVQQLMAESNFEKAYDLIKIIESEGVPHPKIYLLKYLCLNMRERSDISLQNLTNILNISLEIDPNYVPSLIESGYLHLNVLDNVAEASVLFESALSILKEQVVEAVLGQAACIAGLESSDQAQVFLKSIRENLLDAEKVNKFLDEIEIYTR